VRFTVAGLRLLSALLRSEYPNADEDAAGGSESISCQSGSLDVGTHALKTENGSTHFRALQKHLAESGAARLVRAAVISIICVMGSQRCCTGGAVHRIDGVAGGSVRVSVAGH
jgi:hypothetical protein